LIRRKFPQFVTTYPDEAIIEFFAVPTTAIDEAAGSNMRAVAKGDDHGNDEVATTLADRAKHTIKPQARQRHFSQSPTRRAITVSFLGNLPTVSSLISV